MACRREMSTDLHSGKEYGTITNFTFFGVNCETDANNTVIEQKVYYSVRVLFTRLLITNVRLRMLTVHSDSFTILHLITGKFKEPLFHPNVFPSGTVDLNFLSQPQTHWKSSITIMEVSCRCFYMYVYEWL